MYNNNSLLGYAIGDDPKKKQTTPGKIWGENWKKPEIQSGDYYEGTYNNTYSMPPMNLGQQLNVVNPKTSINLEQERLKEKEAVLRNKKIYDEYQKRTTIGGKDSDAYDKSRGIIPYAKWDYSDKGTTTANEIFNKVRR